MGIHWALRDELIDQVSKKVLPTNIVLDVGAGIRPQALFVPTVHLIVEPHQPYIEKTMKHPDEISRRVFLKGTWDEIMPFLPDKSVDTVFAVDVIEHLEKEDGMRFIREAERVAKIQIVIFTPLGLYPQSYESEQATDRWGMDGGYWQGHRSGWEPGDFTSDWEFLACEAFHLTDQHGESLEQPFGAFWAIKTMENRAAPVENRYHIPELPLSFLVKSVYERILSMIRRRMPRKIFMKLKNFVGMK
jgi:hypothetical protein